ncbi:DUF2490 domain-containing protein [Lacihabitans soyangensis]|uniref:DUF2490 domain-containing protein n=1 Tax=Lacihabitans soyangensis TaxID=869394 RepID=A0AAE3H5T8_9BACT|nr:DUF2490 domain-containing protein [Lacihabitans soyangensis]MCP9765433.1 DUF2490 domain-containing protein [Lacihabitans soyangensis]
MKILILIVLCSFSFSGSFAQRITQTDQQLWLGYFNQIRFSNKWGLWFDTHFRTTDQFVKEPSKFLARVGAMYYINDNLKFTNGYTFANHFPEEAHPEISQPEHRLWHQFQQHNTYGKVRTMHWLRLEERFRRNYKDNQLVDGYRFDERIRANYLINVPLSKKGIVPKTFSAIVNDEVMLNLSKKNIYNTFDQNRLFVGLAYNVSSHSNLQFGYMNVYQQLAAGNRYLNLNTIRIFYFQNLDFRKKDK